MNRQFPSPNVSSLDGKFRWDRGVGLLKTDTNTVGVTPLDEGGQPTDIQKAIDYIDSLGGGTVILRNGTYLLNADIVVPSNMNLIGETAGGVILDFQNASYQIKSVGSNTYSLGTISVNNFATTVTGVGTVWTTAMIGQTIFISGLGYTITAVASNTSLTIDRPFEIVSVSGASYAISDAVTDVTLSNFTVQNSIDPDGAIFFQYCSSVTVDAVNVFDSTIGANFQFCFTIEYRGGFTSGCGTGLQVVDSATATLYDFEIYGSTGTNVVLTRFINCSFANFTNSTATSNAITLNACKNIAIYDFAIQSAGAKGIELITCSDIEIMAANVIQAVSDGIKLTSGCARIGILNTSLVNNGGYGINIAAASDTKNSVVMNFYSGNTSGTLNDSGTSTINANNQT